MNFTKKQTNFGQTFSSSPIKIISAVYGTADVTDQVRSIVGNSSSATITASNNVFGDPWYGYLKTLTIVYQVDFGPIQTKIATENGSIIIKANSSNNLKILGASYGTADVTEIVRSKVSNNSLSIAAENSVFGDPWCGVLKTLVISYQFEDNEPKVLVVKEHETAKISLD